MTIMLATPLRDVLYVLRMDSTSAGGTSNRGRGARRARGRGHSIRGHTGLSAEGSLAGSGHQQNIQLAIHSTAVHRPIIPRPAELDSSSGRNSGVQHTDPTVHSAPITARSSGGRPI